MKKTIDEYWKLFKESSNDDMKEESFKNTLERIKADLLGKLDESGIREKVKSVWEDLMNESAPEPDTRTEKEVILDELWNLVMSTGKVSSKVNVLDPNSLVWTKKLMIDLDDPADSTINYSIISITAGEKGFEDALKSDMRVAVVNGQNEYCNNPAKDLPLEKLELILEELTSK